MLQSISDFTIPKSHCRLFYINISGLVLTKTFFKHKGDQFYINGDVFINNKG